jgi:hypothetical protein
MSQTMARPSAGFPQSAYPGQVPGQFQQGQFQQGQPAPRAAPSAGAQGTGFQPLPPGMGTMPGTSTGFGTGMGAGPQMQPSANSMQMQQPNRANLRVDNRVAQPGG